MIFVFLSVVLPKGSAKEPRHPTEITVGMDFDSAASALRDAGARSRSYYFAFPKPPTRVPFAVERPGQPHHYYFTFTKPQPDGRPSEPPLIAEDASIYFMPMDASLYLRDSARVHEFTLPDRRIITLRSEPSQLFPSLYRLTDIHVKYPTDVNYKKTYPKGVRVGAIEIDSIPPRSKP